MVLVVATTQAPSLPRKRTQTKEYGQPLLSGGIKCGCLGFSKEPTMIKVICAFLTILISLTVSAAQEAGGYNQVSLIQLISVPDQFEGQKIRVKGYFRLGVITALYSNHLSADIADWASAIEVVDQTGEGDLTLSCNKMFVVIRGRFVEHGEDYKIIDVQDVTDAKTYKPCWEKNAKEGLKDENTDSHYSLGST